MTAEQWDREIRHQNDQLPADGIGDEIFEDNEIGEENPVRPLRGAFRRPKKKDKRK